MYHVVPSVDPLTPVGLSLGRHIGSSYFMTNFYLSRGTLVPEARDLSMRFNSRLTDFRAE